MENSMLTSWAEISKRFDPLPKKQNKLQSLHLSRSRTACLVIRKALGPVRGIISKSWNDWEEIFPLSCVQRLSLCVCFNAQLPNTGAAGQVIKEDKKKRPTYRQRVHKLIHASYKKQKASLLSFHFHFIPFPKCKRPVFFLTSKLIRTPQSFSISHMSRWKTTSTSSIYIVMRLQGFRDTQS